MLHVKYTIENIRVNIRGRAGYVFFFYLIFSWTVLTIEIRNNLLNAYESQTNQRFVILAKNLLTEIET